MTKNVHCNVVVFTRNLNFEIKLPDPQSGFYEVNIKPMDIMYFYVRGTTYFFLQALEGGRGIISI